VWSEGNLVIVPPPELLVPTVGGGILPSDVALRGAAKIRFRWAGKPDRHIGLYRFDGRDWEFVASKFDSGGFLSGESRRTGHFTALMDTLAPRITPLRPKPRALPGPYSRWALESRVVDRGSGVDPRATRFIVDGKPVPSEWDAEEGLVRWRPQRAPARGSHRYTLVARDRAGNERRASGRFLVQ
jgi:hypothetical protein